MARFKITNLKNNVIAVPPPVARKLGPHQSLTHSGPGHLMDTDAMKASIQRGLISVTPLSDDVPDEIDSATRGSIGSQAAAGLGVSYSTGKLVSSTLVTPSASDYGGSLSGSIFRYDLEPGSFVSGVLKVTGFTAPWVTPFGATFLGDAMTRTFLVTGREGSISVVEDTTKSPFLAEGGWTASVVTGSSHFELNYSYPTFVAVQDNEYRVQLGTITPIAGNLISQGEGFVVHDGTTTFTFIFDKNASVAETSTTRRVVISDAMTPSQVRDAIITALSSTSSTTLGGDLGTGGSALVYNTVPGLPASMITSTVSNGGFVVQGLNASSEVNVGQISQPFMVVEFDFTKVMHRDFTPRTDASDSGTWVAIYS